jgi:UPF0716 protein FxsA
MLLILIALLIAVPVAEIYVIVQVAHGIGVLNTFALLIIISVLGAWLVKVQGLSVFVRTQQQLAAGRMPTNELVDGAILLFAGALMLAPGFLTDVAGILLIIPPTRALVRRLILRSYRKRLADGRAAMWSNGRWGRVVVDVDQVNDPPRPSSDPPRGELPS